MSNYYTMKDAKVRIAEELKNRGWKIYGFKKDESDSMTDYYSPADWNGIATKNGYVLVVDSGKGSCYSEKEITKYNPKGNLSQEDREKIKKLETLRDNNAASEGEKVNCQTMIDRISAKTQGNCAYEVVDRYPKYQRNPGNSKWHIEKNDKIYDKGIGISKFANVPESYMFDINKMEFTSSYKKVWTSVNTEGRVYSDRELTEEQEKAIKDLKTLILRWERVVDGINSMGDGTKETEQAAQQQKVEAMEKVVVTEYKIEYKAVEIEYPGEIKQGMYFKTNTSFTGGVGIGTIYKIDNIIDNNYVFSSRMNSKLTKTLDSMSKRKNSFNIDTETFDKWIKKGSLVMINIEEVKTPFEVVKFIKKENKNTSNKDSNVTSTTSKQENNSIVTEIEIDPHVDNLVEASKDIIVDLGLNCGQWPTNQEYAKRLKEYLHKNPMNKQVVDTIYIEELKKIVSNLMNEIEMLNSIGSTSPTTTIIEVEEVTTPIINIQVAETIINTPVIENTPTNTNIKHNENDNVSIEIKDNYIYIKFKKIPNEDILSQLRKSKFQWKPFDKVWRAWKNESNMKFAKSLLGNNDNNPDPTIPPQPPKGTKINKESLINKINSRIQILNNNIKDLSKERLTNTWKRMRQFESRQKDIESLQFDISLLEYIKTQIQNDIVTDLEVNLISNTYSSMIYNFYIMKYSKNTRDLYYPVVENPESWYAKEQQQKINRLQKTNIYTLEQLEKVVDEYKTIIDKIENPVDDNQRKISELEMKYKMYQKDDIHFTPKEIINSMIDSLQLDGNSTILEPSAGIGSIADQVSKVTDSKIDCIEIDYTFRELLKMKNHNVVGNDFLEFNNKTYDNIIMNPPFSNNQDIKHLQHAYDLLNDNGRLVCLTSNHWSFAQDKESVNFRSWLEDKNYHIKDFDGGKFERTNIPVKMVVIEK